MYLYASIASWLEHPSREPSETARSLAPSDAWRAAWAGVNAGPPRIAIFYRKRNIAPRAGPQIAQGRPVQREQLYRILILAAPMAAATTRIYLTCRGDAHRPPRGNDLDRSRSRVWQTPRTTCNPAVIGSSTRASTSSAGRSNAGTSSAFPRNPRTLRPGKQVKPRTLRPGKQAKPTGRAGGSP